MSVQTQGVEVRQTQPVGSRVKNVMYVDAVINASSAHAAGSRGEEVAALVVKPARGSGAALRARTGSSGSGGWYAVPNRTNAAHGAAWKVR